jgi:transposase, IS5 family
MLVDKERQGELFKLEVELLVNKRDSLVRLGEELNWERFSEKFGSHYQADTGRPSVPIRALVGSLLLKYIYGISDVETMNRLVETPSWQYFCGYRYYFKDKYPFERSLLSVFRKKIGEEGAREIFLASGELALKLRVVKAQDFKRLHVDSTVQEKNITYPHSAKLLKHLLQKLRKSAKKKKLKLKQTYKKECQLLSIQALRYSNARQFNRMKRNIRRLCTCVGRLIRDIERKVKGNQELKDYFAPLIELGRKVIHQSLHKVPPSEYIYSLHERHVACITKGKAHKKYEFGSKVSIAITHKSKFIVDCDTFFGNPHDSKTLHKVINNVVAVTSVIPELIGVDLGYRGSGVIGVVHAKLKRISEKTRAFIQSHPKIEAVISHTKRKFLLSRSRLKGIVGDQMNALFAATAYNLSLVMRRKLSTP